MRVVMNTKALVLLGVSGVGKSSLIEELVKIEQRFQLIAAYTTRPARGNDRHRICVTDAEFAALVRTEELLALNNIYGFNYGTPRRFIEEAFRAERLPLLDCPISKLHTVEAKFPGRIFSVYIEPPSLECLRHRLSDGRDTESLRYTNAVEELLEVRQGRYSNLITHRIVNKDGEKRETAKAIYSHYLIAGESDWPDIDKIKLKNDKYRNSRGGNAILCDITCETCGTRVLLYQKDGKGGLHRCYLNRIFAPPRYERLQYDTSVREPKDLPPLSCSACKTVVGTPMLHSDNRLAFRLRPGFFRKKNRSV